MLLKKLGWWDELTDDEKKKAEGKNWKTDTSGGIIRVAMKNHGCHPFGNAKARAVVWNFPDGIPQHREPLYSPRPDMVAKYPTHDDKKAFWRLPTQYKSIQEKNVADKVAKNFPLVLTSGRLVEYEGGGDETRSNPWLAELQQENFIEINPKDANDRGVIDGEYVWVQVAHRRADHGQGDGHRSRRRRAPRSSRSTSPAGGRARTCSSSTPKARRRSCAARRSTPRRPTVTTR